MSELRQIRPNNDAIYALAAAWASMDGKLEHFAAERNMSIWDAPTGHYEGYMAEAEEMIDRLRTRGFQIVPITETK